MRGELDELPPVAEHRAPLGRGRLDTQAEEAQAGGCQDGRPEAQRRDDERGGHGVRQQVDEHQPPVVGAERAGGHDEVLVLEREDRAAQDAGEDRHREDADRDDHVLRPGAEHRDDRDRQQQAGEGEQDVEQAHGEVVEVRHRPEAAITVPHGQQR